MSAEPVPIGVALERVVNELLLLATRTRLRGDDDACDRLERHSRVLALEADYQRNVDAGKPIVCSSSGRPLAAMLQDPLVRARRRELGVST